MLRSPFRWHEEQLWVELPGATALFTTRRGGTSAGAYESLNLGRWTDDDPDAVRANRERVQTMAGARFAYGRQVHGTEVRVTDRPTETRRPSETDPAAVDGVLTAAVGVAPMVLTADCLPIALVGSGAVGMLHGGWRGLAGGIVARGVQALEALTGHQGEQVAAIGPGAGPCCYQVSEDVHAAFASLGPEVRSGRQLDLKAVARRQLMAAGVATVHDCGLCTICGDPELFFSHRRDQGLTGRQAGVVWRS